MSEESNTPNPQQANAPVRYYSSVVLDTLNSIQNNKFVEYMREKGKPGFDEWRDYGVEVLDLYTYAKGLGIDIVQILGKEGSGKTVGAYTLDPLQTLYLNADDKPLTFPNAQKSYYWSGDNKTSPNHKVVRDYESVKTYLKAAVSKLHPDAKGRLTLFVIAHIDVYKNNTQDAERLRVLGKMATKLNIEGSVIHTYYTWVDPNMSLKDSERYKLLTRNTGFNTGRTPMQMWDEETESKIPNDFKLILDRIIERR